MRVECWFSVRLISSAYSDSISEPATKQINMDYYDGKAVIYKFTSPNGKCYIGQSINFYERFRKYKNNCLSSVGKCFRDAIIRYGGIDSFELTILSVSELDDDISITKNKLYNLEIYYINKFNAYTNGYNLTKGGIGSNGRIVSDETKLKLSASNKGKNAVPLIECRCPNCDKLIFVRGTDFRAKKKKSKNGVFCSRSCSAKYQFKNKK